MLVVTGVRKRQYMCPGSSSVGLCLGFFWMLYQRTTIITPSKILGTSSAPAASRGWPLPRQAWKWPTLGMFQSDILRMCAAHFLRALPPRSSQPHSIRSASGEIESKAIVVISMANLAGRMPGRHTCAGPWTLARLQYAEEEEHTTYLKFFHHGIPRSMFHVVAGSLGGTSKKRPCTALEPLKSVSPTEIRFTHCNDEERCLQYTCGQYGTVKFVMGQTCVLTSRVSSSNLQGTAHSSRHNCLGWDLLWGLCSIHTNGKCRFQLRGGLALLVDPRSPAGSSTFLRRACDVNGRGAKPFPTLTSSVTFNTFPWMDTQQSRGLLCSRTSRGVLSGKLLVFRSSIIFAPISNINT
jgi:hypothetical protein